MSKISIVFFIFLSFVQCVALSFEHEHKFELKKDEWARVFVTQRGTNQRDSFDFRWTLFDNTNIIVHTRYRNYPRQVVMSLRRGLSSYRQSLLVDYKMPPLDLAFLLLEFENFSDAKGFFRVFIKDEAGRMDIEFLDPPKSK